MAYRPGALPALPEIVTPASARALFWRPRYLAASDDLYHLPFLFWLTDLARPRVFASIGVTDGVGYFATCQAMDRLGQPGRCHGVTPGPPGADLVAHNESHYAEISRLIDGTARSLAGQLPDGTVDLLALHGVPDADTIAALVDHWPRKMSARGVIVLHDVAGWPPEGQARHYLDRLARDRPVISFEEGAGLVAVLWGADQPGQLADLAALDPMAPGSGEVRHVFRRLGSAVRMEWAARDSAERAAAAQARARKLEAALADAEAGRAETAEALDRLRQERDARAREVAVLGARLETTENLQDAAGLSDLVRRHGSAQEELGTLRAKLTEAEARAAAGRRAEAEARIAVETAEAARAEAEQMAAARIAAKDRALQQLGTQLATARAQATGRDADADARHGAQADIMALTIQLEAGREDRDAVHRDLQRLKVDHAALCRERDQLRRERDEAQGLVTALLGSTSWKLTAPVRWIVIGLRRLRGGEPQE